MLSPVVVPVVVGGALALILAFGLFCALLSWLTGAKARRAKARIPSPAGPNSGCRLAAEHPPDRLRTAKQPASPAAAAEPTPTPEAPPGGGYTVYVDDNFHYMDERYRRIEGTFPTLEEAINVCRRIVVRSLRDSFAPGMSAHDLFEHYKDFGEDPFIRGPLASCTGVPFSGWTYARQCAETMCKGS